jgi:hypothetical protein
MAPGSPRCLSVFAVWVLSRISAGVSASGGEVFVGRLRPCGAKPGLAISTRMEPAPATALLTCRIAAWCRERPIAARAGVGRSALPVLRIQRHPRQARSATLERAPGATRPGSRSKTNVAAATRLVYPLGLVSQGSAPIGGAGYVPPGVLPHELAGRTDARLGRAQRANVERLAEASGLGVGDLACAGERVGVYSSPAISPPRR